MKLNLSPPFHIQYNGVDLIFIWGYAINHILCIYNCATREKVVLWNPATKEIKVIPHSLGEFWCEFTIDINLHGFATTILAITIKSFNVCVILHLMITNVLVMILHLSLSGRYIVWKVTHGRNSILICVYITRYSWKGKKCAVSFDLSSGVFFITHLPLENVCNGFSVNLAILNGYVGIISKG